MTVSSGSSSSLTPSGIVEVRQAERVADAERGDVGLEAALRDLERQRLDVDLVRDLVQDAALAHADRVADERDLDRGLDRLVEADLLEVDVRDLAAHLVALVLLEDRRVSRAAVDLDVEHGVRPGRARERRPQVALGDRDRDRLGPPVEDARDQPLLAQAARLRRPEQGPLRNNELDALSGHSGGL